MPAIGQRDGHPLGTRAAFESIIYLFTVESYSLFAYVWPAEMWEAE